MEINKQMHHFVTLPSLFMYRLKINNFVVKNSKSLFAAQCRSQQRVSIYSSVSKESAASFKYT